MNAPRFHFHRLMAWWYNRHASQLSDTMRNSPNADDRADASRELLRVGKLSNNHERLREYYRARMLGL